MRFISNYREFQFCFLLRSSCGSHTRIDFEKVLQYVSTVQTLINFRHKTRPIIFPTGIVNFYTCFYLYTTYIHFIYIQVYIYIYTSEREREREFGSVYRISHSFTFSHIYTIFLNYERILFLALVIRLKCLTKAI